MILRRADLLVVGDIVKCHHERYRKGNPFVIMDAPRSHPNKVGYISIPVHPVGDDTYKPTLVLHSSDLIEIVHE